MSLNETPSANRIHIAFFGRCNAGKSSLVNAVTGQNLAVVSDTLGTTTDPVYKAMELLPLGPVVIIDTPGIDDEGELGKLRIQKAQQVLNKTDIAVLVVDSTAYPDCELCSAEKELLDILQSKKIPFIIALNKQDKEYKTTEFHRGKEENHIKTLCNSVVENSNECLLTSAKTGYNINLLKEKIAALVPAEKEKPPLVADLIHSGDFVVLVIPIDSAAPKGRLILPQQQVLRDILDAGGTAIAVKNTGLRETLAALGKKPALVITDSQVFAQVSAEVPQEIRLTSFSILFARYKGALDTAVRGAAALDTLQNGDKVLICEGCTHHRQCGDIGTVLLPRLIKSHSHSEPEFEFCSGGDFPKNLSVYKLIVHCGACMLNDREMLYRLLSAQEQKIPFTNYGTAIAHIQGILERSVKSVQV